MVGKLGRQRGAGWVMRPCGDGGEGGKGENGRTIMTGLAVLSESGYTCGHRAVRQAERLTSLRGQSGREGTAGSDSGREGAFLDQALAASDRLSLRQTDSRCVRQTLAASDRLSLRQTDSRCVGPGLVSLGLRWSGLFGRAGHGHRAACRPPGRGRAAVDSRTCGGGDRNSQRGRRRAA